MDKSCLPHREKRAMVRYVCSFPTCKRKTRNVFSTQNGIYDVLVMINCIA